jgi:uncharacterized metal-binding protein
MAECCCDEKQAASLIYACSGSANTGLLADQVARKLAREGFGKMTCLAAIGAGLSGFVESARAASVNLLLDGCPTFCGRRNFENRGLSFRHFVMTEHGVIKGKTPITEELIASITEALKAELTRDR